MLKIASRLFYLFIYLLLACRISTRRGRNYSKRSKFCTDIPAAWPVCAFPYMHTVGQTCPIGHGQDNKQIWG